MVTDSPTTNTLCDLAPGLTGRIIAIDGGRNLKRRCLALGLRVGSQVTASQRRGQGIVVTCGGSRIALGRGMASKLKVEVLSDSSVTTQLPIEESTIRPEADLDVMKDRS